MVKFYDPHIMRRDKNVWEKATHAVRQECVGTTRMCGNDKNVWERQECVGKGNGRGGPDVAQRLQLVQCARSGDGVHNRAHHRRGKIQGGEAGHGKGQEAALRLPERGARDRQVSPPASSSSQDQQPTPPRPIPSQRRLTQQLTKEWPPDRPPNKKRATSTTGRDDSHGFSEQSHGPTQNLTTPIQSLDRHRPETPRCGTHRMTWQTHHG